MLKTTLFLAFICATNADLSCSREIYSGYPCCKNKMDVKITENGITTCMQAQKALYKDGNWCPNPEFAPPNDLSPESMTPWPAGAPDGHVNFLVYRAATHGDKYASILSNSNAADRAGVLSYLHTEVVPEDMRYREDIEASRRKFGIDSIMIFNVTVYNPKPWQTPQIPLSAYVAFDKGQCLETDPNCKKYQVDGYQVGYQVQANNPRAKYSGDLLSNYWYSFPKGGLCDKPNGTKTCTYTYNVVGRISIDELVHFDRLGYKDYATFAKYNASTASSANIEYKRMGRDTPECCETDLKHSIPFWNSPCDLNQSFARIQAVMEAHVRDVNDTSFHNNTRDCPAGGEDGGKSGLSTGELIAIIAGGVVVVGIAGYVMVYMMKSKNKAEKQPLMTGQQGTA